MAPEAATSWKAAPEVQPSVWGDFFINYIPEPLQACVFIHQLASIISLSFFPTANTLASC